MTAYDYGIKAGRAFAEGLKKGLEDNRGLVEEAVRELKPEVERIRRARLRLIK